MKEIQKVISDLDKKHKTARILEVYALHSKDEVQAELDEKRVEHEKVIQHYS